MSAHSSGWFSVGERNGTRYTADGTTFISTAETGGGLAPSFDYSGVKMKMDIAHTHNMQHNHTVDISHTHNTNEDGAHTHSVTAAGTNSNNGGTEVRPVDYTYKIWKRTA